MKTNIRENIHKFTIGQDGEFLMLLNGKAAPFEGHISDEIGLDGATGANRVSEVRTCPSEDPIEIVNCIHQAFKRKIKKHPKVLRYNWEAGSFKLHAIGGHLHVGYDKKIIKPEILNLIIGNYVGSLSLAIEDKDEAYMRRNHDYGSLTDWRKQDWGMESRCFSSWLVSPQIALAHLCLFKTVVYEALNNKSFSPVSRFTDDDFFCVNQDRVRNLFDEIWKDITQMALYPQYKQYIDMFKFLIENKLTWYNRISDLKVTWGLGGFQEPEKTTVDFMALWRGESSNIFHY